MFKKRIDLESWVNKENLHDDQSLENNFNINPERPMKFVVGTLFDSYNILENVEYTFIICKIKGMFS
jgi:ABC-type transporter Mla maintaining outer membrane lipid asymmetry ATPase subunit MlaF